MAFSRRLAAISVSMWILSAILRVAGAAEMPTPPKLMTFYTQVPITENGQAKCFVATPDGQEYARLGDGLAEAIERISGARIDVRSAGELSGNGGDRGRASPGANQWPGDVRLRR